jgi:hypothetical protein
MTLLVQLYIHYEAFRLWLKGVQIVPHPNNARNAFTDAVEAVMTPLFRIRALLDSLHITAPATPSPSPIPAPAPAQAMQSAH